MTKQQLTTRAYQAVTGITAAVYIGTCVEIGLLVRSIDTTYVSLWAWYIASQLVPGVVFLVLWLFTRGSRWERLYQTSLVTIATTLFTTALTTLLFTFIAPLVFTAFASEASLWMFNAAPLVLQLLVTVAATVLLRRQVDVKRALRFVVTLLMIALGAFFVLNSAQTAYSVITQYPDNQNLSAYVSSFVGYSVVAVLFFITYIFEKRRGVKHSIRTATLVTAMGVQMLYVAAYLSGLFSYIEAAQWLVAVVITVCCIVGIVAYRWLYRTLRVLA